MRDGRRAGNSLFRRKKSLLLRSEIPWLAIARHALSAAQPIAAQAVARVGHASDGAIPGEIP